MAVRFFSLAEKLLRRQGKNFSKITSELMDINKYYHSPEHPIADERDAFPAPP
ncbi:hypothetical protein [Mesorhizobium sp. M0047]|uniref:hypothetical protein n=1 Tax=Mesorhizobium sp. M0047 TaxID=2956859 RepID=UPI00333690A0